MPVGDSVLLVRSTYNFLQNRIVDIGDVFSIGEVLTGSVDLRQGRVELV